MGFEISDHLLRGLHHLMSKTEFDNAIFDRSLFSQPLNPWLPAENRLSIRARQQPLREGRNMFDRN